MKPISNRSSARIGLYSDQMAAYHLTRKILLADPGNVAAWLQLSKLLSDPRRQQECLQRVLALDPPGGAR